MSRCKKCNAHHCSCRKGATGATGATGGTGAAGAAGGTGGTGGTGATGAAGSSLFLQQFSGLTTAFVAGPPVDNFLADGGNEVTSPAGNQAFPIGAPTTFTRLTAQGVAGLAPGETVIFTLLRNGVATGLTLTFAFGDPSQKTIAGSEAYVSGQVYDVRTRSTSLAPHLVSATLNGQA